jgi:hypothetical protein
VAKKMYLYGGEQDGLEIPLKGELPQVYYIVPHEDQAKIDAAKTLQAKGELCHELAVLAYEYKPQVSDAEHFYMLRNPTLDKVTKP